MANDDEFIHAADIEAITKQLGWEVQADVNDWLGDWAKDFNRRQPRGGFITMKMDHKPRRRPRPLVIREDLLRDLSCDICERAYGVYAIALFCPDCGAPNLALHFRREIALIHDQISLAAAQDTEGKSELAYRIMGNAHEDVLTTFETTLKTIYRHLVRCRMPEKAAGLCGKKAIANAFQNIERGRRKFGKIGVDPYAGLSPDDLALLALNIEKRHVIGHNLGIADEHYVELTQAEQPGETVRLIADEIGRFADICQLVVAHLETALLPSGESSDRVGDG